MDQSKSSYPGNRDLPVEVKDRVLSTYQQSLEMHRLGRLEEAQAGCELILRMDSSFAPARRLMESLQSSARPAGSGTDNSADTLAAAKRALDTRDFRRAVELSNTVLRAELTNQQAQDIGREAQERLEAEPFVDQYLKKAESHIRLGNLAAARADLGKARSLDPGNPALAKLDNQASTPSPPAATPSPAAAAPNPLDFGSDSPFQFDFATGSSPAAPDTSFILDEPPPVPSARTSQASDFGFSFEEETAPPPQPSVPEPQTFDFSSAPTESNESNRQRIDSLLREGDVAFEQANYRQATEIWSKVFLIDVTNAAASERIEKARRQQQELDSRVDDILASSIADFDAGKLATARSGFEQVLRLDPTQPAALDYLHRIPADPDEPHLDSIDYHPPPTMVEPEEDLYAAYGIPQATATGTEELSPFAPAVPPSPGSSASATRSSQPGTRPVRRRGSWLILVAVLVVLGGAGWFAWSQLADTTSDTIDDQTELILTRAQALAKAERYDQAIDLLSSIGAEDPMQDRALALIADYRARKAAGASPVDGKPAAVVFAGLTEQGLAAFMAHDYVAAKDALTRAAAIQPLSADFTAILQNATLQVAKLDSALVLFKEGKYDAAVGTLQGLLQQDPENRNIKQLLENAHFNLGANALREDRLDEAIREFDSVIASNPTDDIARRSREIALRYREEPKDLLFRIYVKYLPLR